MSEERFQSFEEFWPFYVREHSNKWNRRLHFVGTTAAMGLVAAGLLTKKRWLLALAPVAGYGMAWIGHFGIEKNRPATFKYPAWSLRGDFKMWAKMVTFKMDAEVEKALAAEADKNAKAETPSDGQEVSTQAQPSTN